jgi:hypothetical protein
MQVTVVVPAVNVEPDSGLQTTGQIVAPLGDADFALPAAQGQLSVALGGG